MPELKNTQQMEPAVYFWKRRLVYLIAVLIAVSLWGSAFPAVKLAYQAFSIQTEKPGSVPSLLLLAGIRFVLAGGMVLLFYGLTHRTMPSLKRVCKRDVLILSMFQTVLQYGTFFIGLSHTQGAIASIISASSSFMSILFAAMILTGERMNLKRWLGILIGFSGIVILNLAGISEGVHFSLHGEGLMVLSTVASAISAVISKPMAERNQPQLLCGFQFLIGGIFLLIIGSCLGGHIQPTSPKAYICLLYMGMISAVAFSLWTTLIKYHSVSQLSIFKGLIPVVGTLGSALVLHESITHWRYPVALLLIVISILCLNLNKQDLGAIGQWLGRKGRDQE